MGDPLTAEQWVWGVDLGLRSTVLCALRPARNPEWRLVDAGEGGSISERLARLARRTEDSAVALSATHPPACVMVEQPIAAGKMNPHLLWACGVVSAALASALADVSVWHVGVSSWKKATVGRGNATKEEVREWAAAQGHPHLPQDQADALAIAAYTLDALEVSS